MTIDNVRTTELVSQSGLFLVVTGTTGAGKDSVTEKLRESNRLAHLNLSQVVTTASRDKRPGEIHGFHYFFSSVERMTEMKNQNEFIEPLTSTGTDWKATQKSQILPVLHEGANRIWRIDLSRAADVAAGGYFHNYLNKEEADRLEERTLVLLIEGDPGLDYETLMDIRQKRDGEKFNRKSYELRDEQEAAILSAHGHHFKHRIINRWNKLDNTVEEVADLILNFN